MHPPIAVFTRLALFILFAALLVSGCRPANPPEGQSTLTPDSSGPPLKVVATVGMVADLVKHIGGPQVNVQQMMGAGVDPHLYTATRDAVQLIMDADMVFYSGLMLEGRLADTLQKLSKSTVIVAVAEKLPSDKILHPPDSAGHADPHVWMDVSLWSQCMDVIVESLSTTRPMAVGEFRQRADELRSQLEQLHQYGLTSIQSIPRDQRVLITSHDAFRYFGRAYGIEVIGIQGLSTESEAGLQRINELVDLLVSRRISAVFVESSVPQKNITALIDGAASRGHRVHIGGELFSDAMGPMGTWEGTYIGMMDHNFTRVSRALGGNAPQKGMHDRLATQQ